MSEELFTPESQAGAQPLPESLAPAAGPRDNKTAIELFIAGVRGWDAEIRRWFARQEDVFPPGSTR